MFKQTMYAAWLTATIAMPWQVFASRPAAPEVDITQLNAEAYRAIYLATPPLSSAFYSVTPQKKADGLPVSEAKQPANLLALAKDIATGKFGAYDSVVIAHKDQLIFESYFNRGRADMPHFQASATKGYTSLAVGRAIEMGYLKMEDLHKPVLDFLTEVERENLVPGAQNVTLHHTLSMRSGMKVTDEQRQAMEASAEQFQGQKLAQGYFTRSTPVTGQSQKYNYQGLDVQLSMLVLDAVVPGTAKAFIEQEVLSKLGITSYGWREHFSGILQPGSGSYFTSRDMIKFASLLKNEGKWQGEQLISKAYLKQATGSVATPVDPEFDYTHYRYGYYFWGTTLHHGDQQFDVNLAWGGGQNMTIAIPELDLTVAVAARIREDSQTFELLEKHVLPMFAATRKEESAH